MKLILALSAALVFVASLSKTGPAPFGPDRIRGAWLSHSQSVPLTSPAAVTALAHLKELGADTVAIGPEVMMPDITRPGLVYGSEDPDLRKFLRAAKGVGLGVFMLPRIESPAFFQPPHPWRADIRMTSDADWERFHDDYAKMIAHYGALGREEGVRVLGIGLEYRATVKQHPGAWRRIAGAAKAAFQGPITYSANWDDYRDIAWWDAVDYIGIGAYFELLDDGLEKDRFDPKNRLRDGHVWTITWGWHPIKKELKSFSEQYDRPVLFTEVGYTTFYDTAYYPWRWQNSGRAIDPHQQAEAYRALFRAFTTEPWWKGVCLWRWYTDPSGVPEWDYSPQGREAEGVVKDAYHR